MRSKMEYVIETFQSTRPHGARHAQFQLLFGGLAVSIHAPARGATYAQALHRVMASCFNPRARTGRDVNATRARIKSLSFNPRARTGRDCALVAALDGQRVSIHAPARGATSVT